MTTRRIESTDEAARIIRDGGLVAFPTETVFGLGVDATNTQAVESLFVAKGRPSDNPLIVHLGDKESWAMAASKLTPHAEALLAAYSPGPLTVVLPKNQSISSLVTAGLETVGVRIPDHPIAQEIIRKSTVPVAAPSANRSGRPSSTTWRSVLEDLDGRVDAVLCQDSESIGIESTVVDCCGPVPVVLRPGAISIEQVRRIVPEAEELSASRDDFRATNHQQVNSPGLLHPHYQPSARVVLVESPSAGMVRGNEESAYCGLIGFDGMEDLAVAKVFSSVEQYAAGFYEFLREADRHAMKRIYVQTAPEDSSDGAHGIGRALQDRQRRAASG